MVLLYAMNRRRTARYKPVNTQELKSIIKIDNTSFKCDLLDISEGGVGLKIPSYLIHVVRKGLIVFFSCELFSEIEGTIRYIVNTQGITRVGIEFTKRIDLGKIPLKWEKLNDPNNE